MSQRLSIALNAAKTSGMLVGEYFETSLEKRTKEDSSIVTIADEASEKVIIEALKEAFPDDAIVGEEGGGQEGTSGYAWFVDPLDGTRNFANGIPIFSISIGVEYEGMPYLGVVYNPATSSLFWAEKGSGAFWNDNPIRVSTQSTKDSIVTLGTSRKELDKTNANWLIRELNENEKLGCSVRVLGSMALELCYVARGGTEAVINLGTQKYDYMAGTAILLEAGGTITGLKGDLWTPENGYCVASNGVVHNDIISATKDL
jgi:myo-inositol-1(or 4)-monophosphatase